jgi:hypothetical protein
MDSMAWGKNDTVACFREGYLANTTSYGIVARTTMLSGE